VKAAYQTVGFKWKTLSNDPTTGRRAQIMQLNKPPTCPDFQNERKLDLGKEPLTMKAGLVMSLKNTEEQIVPPSGIDLPIQAPNCFISSLLFYYGQSTN